MRDILSVYGSLTLAIILSGVATPLACDAADPDPLESIGARATEGATAGYVEDRVCGTCHQQLFQSYQDVGMAQAFKQPANARPLEDFGEEYFHAPSQRYYQVLKDGDELTFRRYQRDNNGGKINEIEIPIAWALGSGNRVRSFLYRTDWGELFLLPISWYSQQQQWRMSPGFEHATHQGIQRRIKRECLFCHNAFPEVATGSDAHWAPELFPDELPEGIGCQRCHGPGAEHIRTMLRGGTIDEIRDAIVNPADLTGEIRDSVCFQCHMLPSVSVVGARRIGHTDYSFRPGQLLSDYIVHVDIAEQGVAPGERFEINHHAYRLYQSACYRESDGALSCISCHDPHVKPESTAFREKSSGVCMGCHSNVSDAHGAGTSFQSDDCIGCHMPERRTSDVVEVTMTDHRIATGPFDADDLIAPIETEMTPVTGIGLLDFAEPPDGQHGNLYRMIAALRANRFVEPAKNELERHLEQNSYDSPTPYIDLAQAQIKVGDYRGAESTAGQLIANHGELAIPYSLLGMSQLAQGQSSSAIENLNRSLGVQPNPEAYFNLAAAYLQTGDIDNAEIQLERAIELRPYMAAAWKYKGIILMARNQAVQARQAFVRSLAIEPTDASTYRDLITLLRDLGDDDEAQRFLELGLRVSNNPAILQQL